jgi:hypothetical protein
MAIPSSTMLYYSGVKWRNIQLKIEAKLILAYKQNVNEE